MADNPTLQFTKEDILSSVSVSVDEHFDRDNHLYLYAIVRKDLDMPAGKLAAQSGHAFEYALREAQKTHLKAFKDYDNPDLGGSKVVLKAKNESQIINAYNQALSAGLPCSIVVDRHHVMPPHFDGSPIITAMAIGPCKREDARFITKKFNCY